MTVSFVESLQLCYQQPFRLCCSFSRAFVFPFQKGSFCGRGAKISTPFVAFSAPNIDANPTRNFAQMPQSPNQERMANIGRAIDALSHDYSKFFDGKTQDFSIYHSNLQFDDYTHSLSLTGLSKYQMVLTFCKKLLSAVYSEMKLELCKAHMQNESTFVIRWRFTGRRRFRLLRQLFHGPENVRYTQNKMVEGLSYYVFDEVGLVQHHIIDHVEPPLQKWHSLKALFWWIGRQPDAIHRFQPPASSD